MAGRGPTSPRTISSRSLGQRRGSAGLLARLSEHHRGRHPCPHVGTAHGHCFETVSDFSNNPSLACFVQNGDNCHLRLSRQFQQLVEQGPDRAPLARSREIWLPCQNRALTSGPRHLTVHNQRALCVRRPPVPPRAHHRGGGKTCSQPIRSLRGSVPPRRHTRWERAWHPELRLGPRLGTGTRTSMGSAGTPGRAARVSPRTSVTSV